MSDLKKDFNTLVAAVVKQCGGQGKQLKVVGYPSNLRAYMLKAPKYFAWVHLKTRLDCLRVGTEQKWAAGAGVARNGYKKSDGAFGRPSYHWDIAEGDNSKLMKVVRYLSQVCRLRNSD